MKSHLVCLRSGLVILALAFVGAFPSSVLAQQTGIEAALPAIRSMNDPGTLVGALSGAAEQKLAQGDIEKASEYIDEAIAIARQANDATMLPTPLMTATRVLSKLSPDAASKFLTGLLKDSAGNAEFESVILERLGQHLQMSGDTVAAIQVLHDFAAKTKELSPDSEAVAWAYLRYGQACVNARMFDIGQAALQESKELSTQLKQFDVAGLCDASLANACLGTEQYDLAAKLYLQQLDSAKKSGNENSQFSAIGGLVNALIGLRRNDDAKQVLSNNLPSAKGIMRGELLSYSAVLAVLDGEFAEAVALSKQASEARLSELPFISRAVVGATTTMLDHLACASYLASSNQHSDAMATLQQAENGYRQMRTQLERAAKSGGVSLDASLTALSDLTASISEIRQRVLVAQGKTDEALLESERGRALVQTIAMRRNFGWDQEESDSPEQDLNQIRQLAKRMNTTLVEYSVVHSLDYVTRSRLGGGSTEAQPDAIYIWVISPDEKITFHSIKLTNGLNEMVNAARDEITGDSGDDTSEEETDNEGDTSSQQDRDSAAHSQTSDAQSTASVSTDDGMENLYALTELLIDPIEARLPSDPNDLVVVVPHRDLFAVPFAALPDATGAPWVIKHSFATASSIELYGLAAKRRGESAPPDLTKILVVGNPSMPSYRYRPDRPASPLDPLPGSEKEAKAIAAMLGIQPLVGEAATESAVRQRIVHAPIIHMATHGLLESDNVFSQSYLSAIALAADDSEDGFLTVREIMNMELSAELAVLSACDSGRGKITGDGVVGLSRAYLTAGVPTVVVSLWPVSDQATAYMMVNFYAALTKGQTKAQALRTAILATREKAPATKLWAPFMISGYGG